MGAGRMDGWMQGRQKGIAGGGQLHFEEEEEARRSPLLLLLLLLLLQQQQQQQQQQQPAPLSLSLPHPSHSGASRPIFLI